MDLKNYGKTYFTDIIFNHFFDFKGRASRKVFWLFNLNLYIITLALSYMLSDFGLVSIIIGIAFSLILLLPTLGLDVRRLHDIDFSGWWVLVFFIPFVGFVILFVFACLPGTEGENKYGPAPINSVDITE
jgi:uncharacterized membrane protein YhaH (DUF805 family)